MQIMAGAYESPVRELCRVVQPGALSTVQDQGRWGFQSIGLGPGGVLDRCASAQANWLLGNDPRAAVLEMTLMGATLEFLADSWAALTGADMGAKLNGQPAPRYRAFPVRQGDVLQLGFVTEGCRSYLAVWGGVAVPVVYGSRSTNLKCALGGFQGRALKAGDQLSAYVMAETEPRAAGRELAIPQFPKDFTLRFIPGPQEDYFSKEARETFVSSVYQVSAQSDRMGCRLEGAALSPADPERGMDIVSDGIALGGIQVSNQGQPIVLLADRQTTGGYAKIGTVLSCDLPKLAQALPGATVHFAEVSVEVGQAAYRDWLANMFKQ